VAASTQTSPDATVDPELLRRYADLVVGFGANVQQGQIVELRADFEKRALVHALAEAAYRRGAKFVDVNWFDPWVRRSRIEHADPDTLDFVPRWHRERVLQLGELRCARIALAPTGPTGVVADLDPTLVAREPFPFIPEYFRVIDDNTTNWTGVPGPTRSWAEQVHPELDSDEALAKLWEEIVHVMRLDEDDPVAAWERRFEELDRVTRILNERRFDALRFHGPGTELTVGLFPTSTWDSGDSTTVGDIRFAANLPTEEIYTAPDPTRTHGHVTSTKPLVLKGGTVIRGLRVRFEGGRAVEIDADEGAEALRSRAAHDDGAARLGEVALVDRGGRIGKLGTVFWDTLLDENAASHVALGSAYLETVGDADRDRVNRSGVHIDFMIGSDDVDVTATTRDGDEVPLLRGGDWQL
jgi:aminopeptidase